MSETNNPHNSDEFFHILGAPECVPEDARHEWEDGIARIVKIAHVRWSCYDQCHCCQLERNRIFTLSNRNVEANQSKNEWKEEAGIFGTGSETTESPGDQQPALRARAKPVPEAKGREGAKQQQADVYVRKDSCELHHRACQQDC